MPECYECEHFNVADDGDGRTDVWCDKDKDVEGWTSNPINTLLGCELHSLATRVIDNED